MKKGFNQGWKKNEFFRKNPTHPVFLEKPIVFFKRPGLNVFFFLNLISYSKEISYKKKIHLA